MIKKVLIVDDDSTNRYMLETLLKGYGFEVISAENGEDALDKAILNPPDLIVTDILMPVMDGYALCRRWRSDDTLKHIPLVFYTATYTGSKNEDFALSLGADRFILKPQEPDILMNILKEVLEENYVAKQVTTKALDEEMEFFRQYNEILFKKLEKKMLDLEIANQELRILEERYRLSFENVTDVIYTIDTDLNLLSMSPSVERILGYKPQDFIGRPVSDLIDILTPESFEQAIADISLVLKGAIITATIYRFIAKDGTIKYGEVSGSPVIREGKVIGIISVARDITDRKLVEEKLRESEKKYREMYDFLPISVYEMDFEANITSANRAIYETLGGTEEDIKKGFKAWQLLSPEDIDKSAKNIERLLKGEQIGGTEYTLMRLDGSVFPAIVISSVIYSNDKPMGLRGAIVDITERKQAEEKLRRMNAFLDSIIENIPDMIFLKDAKELRFVRFNRAGENLLGHSRDDLLGKNDYDFFPKDQADFFTEKDREVFRGKEVVDVPEEHIQTRNKGERILHTKKVPIPDKNGEPEYLLGISEDITDRKQAEQALRESEERYKALFDRSLDLVYIHDFEGRFLDANDAALNRLGYTREEIRSMSFASLLSEDQFQVAFKSLQEIQETGIQKGLTEFRLRHKNGGEVYVETQGSAILSNGTPLAIQAIARDITERKRAEKELILSESRYRNIFENAIEGIYQSTPQGKYITVNPAYAKMLGYETPEELISSITDIARQIYVNHDERSEIIKQLNVSDRIDAFELQVFQKDGTIIWFLANARVIHDEKGNTEYIEGRVQDITHRKRTEEELKRTFESLRKAVGTTIQVMVSAVEARDPYTAGHQARVADLARAIATEMGLPQEKIDGIRMAGTIHDLGKLSVPAEILSKPTKLTKSEFSLIKDHSQSGYEILKHVESSWPLAEIVYQHHERMDGSGYPRNLKGDEILMEARIMAVADVVESMASHRPYRPALGINVALEEIEKNRGTHYDNTVADACLRLFRDKGFQLEKV